MINQDDQALDLNRVTHDNIDLKRFKNKSQMSLTGTIYTPTKGHFHNDKKLFLKLKNNHSASKKDEKLDGSSRIPNESSNNESN